MTKNAKRIDQAKELLTMIEAVDCEDRVTMVEINCLFWCCLQDKRWMGNYIDGDDAYVNEDKSINYIGIHYQPYASSRDALKAARPPEWKVIAEGYADQFVFELTKCVPAADDYLEDIEVSSPYMPTEELAEFHAIVQAWIYVWENE